MQLVLTETLARGGDTNWGGLLAFIGLIVGIVVLVKTISWVVTLYKNFIWREKADRWSRSLDLRPQDKLVEELARAEANSRQSFAEVNRRPVLKDPSKESIEHLIPRGRGW